MPSASSQAVPARTKLSGPPLAQPSLRKTRKLIQGWRPSALDREAMTHPDLIPFSSEANGWSTANQLR